MRFPQIKEIMRSKINSVRSGLNDFEQELNFINSGEKYSNDDLFKKKLWLDTQLMELEELHDIACKFKDEFCSCGSGLLPNDIDSSENPVCNECFIAPIIESSGG